MADKRDLERRIAELEQQLAAMKQGRPRGVRYRSSVVFADIPLLAIAMGPDPERGEIRGHAKGILALGDMATGVIAVGGLARGLFAFGGLAVGGLTFGGLSLGVIAAIGGLAIGSLALGGGAGGGVAVGGGAAGYYACGGGALGKHVVSPIAQDPEALAFFRRYGLERLCRGR
jgi:hypothetical protein